MVLNLHSTGSRALARLTNETPPEAMYHHQQFPESCPRSCRALIVDDDPDIPPVVQFALSRYDIACDAVNTGAAAVASVRDNQPSIIILDLGMPDTSGFDVLRIVRADARFSRIPIVVLTANHEDLSLARSLGYGADDYVTKPFNPAHLAMRVYCLLRPRHR